MNETTWRKEILKTIKETEGDDIWIIASTLSEDELDEVFDSGHGREKGKPFTAWTENYVYFPICYDGAEWCGAAPRNPCNIKLKHQGGA